MNWLHGICKIVHRDLKRANLVLDDNPHIHVADFGFSEYLRKQAGLQDMTAPKGTVLYMAAEVMKQKEINKKGDVYCFGLIVYEVLTDEEYERMTSCQGTIRIDLEPGDNVRIKTGSVENAIGTVEEINAEEHKVKVSIEILNRKTTVEYDISEVERL